MLKEEDKEEKKVDCRLWENRLSITVWNTLHTQSVTAHLPFFYSGHGCQLQLNKTLSPNLPASSLWRQRLENAGVWHAEELSAISTRGRIYSKTCR